MADDKKNLYKLVTQANKDNPDGAKSRFGYTVDGAYKGSVSVLESAYYDIQTVQVAGGGGIAPAGTFNPSSGLQASEQYSVMSNADGLAIKIEAGSKWTTQYQGLCLVRDYMSFYVSVKDETKYAHVPIGYQNVKNNDYYGQSLAGKYSFPSFEAGESKNNKYDRDDYIVGVGLDFDNFVIPYLKKFFNEDGGKWEVNTLRTIGGKLQMFAEILFPKTNLEEDKEKGEYKATNYYVIHSPVTFDYHIPSMMGFFILHFPVPLFLVSDFSALGTVNVKKQQKLLKVGGGQIGAPFSSGKYKHKEAKIDGFKYSQYSKVGDTVLKQTKIDHIGSARCFVRIFFDRAAQSELGLSSSLSEQQKKNLFTGAYDANQFVARRVIDAGGGVDYSITGIKQFLEDLMSQLNNKFPINQLMNAMRSVGLVEAGGDGNNTTKLNWAKFEDIGDGQGVSMGGFQCTEKAGGLAKFANHYRNRAKDIPPDVDAMLNAFAKKKGSKSSIKNSGLQAAYKNTFAKIGNTTQGIMAQFDTWKQEKWELTKKVYNAYNASCAMQFFCISGAVNHLPGIYEKVLDNYKSIFFTDSSDLATRCKYFQACHWQAWRNYINSDAGKAAGYGKWRTNLGGNGTAPQFLTDNGIEYLRDGPTQYGHGQARRLWAVLWNIRDGNLDLTKRLITRERTGNFPGAPYRSSGKYPPPNNSPS